MVQLEEKTAQALNNPMPPSYQPVPGGNVQVQPPFQQPQYLQQPPLIQAAPPNAADIGQQYQQQRELIIVVLAFIHNLKHRILKFSPGAPKEITTRTPSMVYVGS
jgi:hypothetical protein